MELGWEDVTASAAEDRQQAAMVNKWTTDMRQTKTPALQQRS